MSLLVSSTQSLHFHNFKPSSSPSSSSMVSARPQPPKSESACRQLVDDLLLQVITIRAVLDLYSEILMASSLFVASQKIFAPTVLLGEGLAIWAGLQSVVDHGFSTLVVESDTAELVSYLNNPSSAPPFLAQFVIEDILSLGYVCNATFHSISPSRSRDLKLKLQSPTGT
ncbi:hypothetical protein NE237_024223 [Protea cynaroides]|uniref:RNase H type-1 domain-containing protein n=1 Tax=Protea cynaroides TaxID=273540 RepID=A0A9Q0HI95_9MAGN|nr:hypothetical protein NE237_024223 [Protea cynaroides]